MVSDMGETAPDLLVCVWRGFVTGFLGPIEWGLVAPGNDMLALVPDAESERSSRCVWATFVVQALPAGPSIASPRSHVLLSVAREVSQPGPLSCLMSAGFPRSRN